MTLSTSPYSEIIARGKQEKIYEYSLLLASQNIPHEIGREGYQYILSVREDVVSKSYEILDLYLHENRGWYPFMPSELPLKLSPYPLILLFFPILTFLAQTGAKFNGSRIAHLGSNDSYYVLQGEWWRSITALTLHLDLQHFTSNMVTGFFLLTLLVNRMNWAFTLFLLTILSGLANYFNVILSHPHRSIGFSTAVFACLGMLVAIQLAKNFSSKNFTIKAWTPLLGGAFLVALMGLNENTDISAHVLGFVFGLAGGFFPDKFQRPFDSKQIKFLTILGVVGIYSLCWLLALR